MTSPVLKESVVESLYNDIDTNLDYYVSRNEVWIDDHFSSRSIYLPTKLPDLSDSLLQLPDTTSFYDRENSEALYKALSGLSPSQAADPRLWTYLTHVKFWRYMRARWEVKPVSSDPAKKAKDRKTKINTILSRYFLVGDKARGLTRNGISRLWWSGFTCQNKGAAEEFAYGRALFATQDVYASLMERAFSKNRKIIQPVLEVLTERLDSGKPFDDRDQVRDLGKHLVLLGGAMVLDMLDRSSVKTLVSDFIKKL